MKKDIWNEGLNHIDADLVEAFVKKSEKLEAKSRTKRIVLRAGALAACLLLITGSLALFGEKTPPVPVWNDARYTAEDMANVANIVYDSGGTNIYQEVCALNKDSLYLYRPPYGQTLNVYQYTPSSALEEHALYDFAAPFIGKLATAVGVEVPALKCHDHSKYGFLSLDTVNLEAYTFYGEQTCMYSWVACGGDALTLDGELVQIDQRQTDEQIIASLDSIKNKLFDLFGVTFQDVRLVRKVFDEYSDNGAERIDIYFYDASAHPLNASQEQPVSDQIRIFFINQKYHADVPVSDSFLTNVSIGYLKNRGDISEEYQVVSQEKMITLEAAEALLYNGYVFCRHVCPLCMAAQEKVSFRGYDFVTLEYLFAKKNSTPTVGYPFYAFYKKIGTGENGNIVYAKTYVPAIPVKGYQEYFESQTKVHENDNYSSW